MLRYALAKAEIVVVEVGGDFLDARAPETLSYLVGRGARCGIVVNDAMGALEGMRRLRALGADPFAAAASSKTSSPWRSGSACRKSG
jgi:hypothetical protein